MRLARQRHPRSESMITPERRRRSPLPTWRRPTCNQYNGLLFEGSWSWLQLAPTGDADTEPRSNPNHFSLGVLNVLSFRSLWPDVLSATVGGKTVRAQPRGCRPGGATSGGRTLSPCGAAAPARQKAPGRSSLTLLTTAMRRSAPGTRWTSLQTWRSWERCRLQSQAPATTSCRLLAAVDSLFERKRLLARMDAFSSTPSGNTTLDRFWLLRNDLAGKSRSQ